jgi:hypothetical protein
VARNVPRQTLRRAMLSTRLYLSVIRRKRDVAVELPILLGNQCRDKIGSLQPCFLEGRISLAQLTQGIVP